MLVDIVLQCRDIAAVTVAADYAVFRESGLGKLFHRCLLDVLSDTHLQIAGIAMSIQGQRHKNFRLFCATPPLLSCGWAPKVRIVKLNNAFQPMLRVALPHGRADSHEHIPGRLIGDASLGRKLYRGNAPLVAANQVEGQKPGGQAHMAPMEHRPRSHRGLSAALGTLA